MVDLAPPESQQVSESCLNKVSPLRSTVLKSFLPPREFSPPHPPGRRRLCNGLPTFPRPLLFFLGLCILQSSSVQNRSRRNQCISDAELKCAQPKPKKPMHFRCRAQMCTTEAEETNAFPMQSPIVQNCSRRNQCVPNVQIFSCARKSPGLPRCTLMQRPQVPGANVHKCRKQFNAAG